MEWAQSGFAERLEEALKKRGLTQVKFCEEHGFNRGTLSGWKEKSEPSYEDMFRLAEKLQVRPGWLYFNDTFEAADDEEKSLIEVWRKMTEAERSGFLNTFKAIADARIAQKKPGKRTKPSTLQTSAEIVIDRDVIKPKTFVGISAKEPEEKYGVKPIGPRQPVNLRHLLPVYHRTTPEDPKAVPIPKWLNMAAGDGSDLELCEDYIYFRELPDWKGVHSAVIRGDSMLMTLEPGDVVVMKEFDGGVWELPQIEHPDEKAPLVEFKRRTKLGDNDICVLSINDDPPTLKRIVFDTSRGTDWKLQIIADNPPAWRTTFQVALGDKVVFHAKIMGISDEARTQLRAKDTGPGRAERLKTKKK